MSTLPSLKTNQIIPIVEQLSQQVKLRPEDTFTLKCQKGFVAINVKRGDTGETTTLQLHSTGAYKKWVKFDPASLTPKKRVELVKELHASRMTQSAIASELGVSQATISLDLRR